MITETVAPTTSVISPSNAVSSPTSTALGLGLVGSMMTQLATSGIPTSAQGWLPFALQGIAALFGIFGR